MPGKICLKAFFIALTAAVILAIGREVSAFCFGQAGRLYNISPHLLRAIARVESGLNPSAVNQNGDGSYDYGLMQINSRWQDGLNGNFKYLSDPCYNVMVGSWILRQCMDRYGYTWDAVACYNTGKGISELRGSKKKRAINYIRRVRRVLHGIGKNH